jgi:hypothetical protein
MTRRHRRIRKNGLPAARRFSMFRELGGKTEPNGETLNRAAISPKPVRL